MGQVLSEADQKDIQVRHQKLQEHLKVNVQLKPEFLKDPDTLAAIIARGKRQEIENTRYESFLSCTELAEPIKDFPSKVTNPTNRILPRDECFGPTQNVDKNRKRHLAQQKKQNQEREIHRHTYQLNDQPLLIFRMYPENQAWHVYCRDVLQVKPEVEAMKYILTAEQKVVAALVLEDAKRLRTTLSIYNPLSTLSSAKDLAQIQLDFDLRHKLVPKRRDLREKLVSNRVSRANDMREILDEKRQKRDSGFRISLTGNERIIQQGYQFLNAIETAKVPNGTEDRPTPFSHPGPEIPLGQSTTFCPEQSQGLVHAQEVADIPQSESLPDLLDLLLPDSPLDLPLSHVLTSCLEQSSSLVHASEYTDQMPPRSPSYDGDYVDSLLSGSAPKACDSDLPLGHISTPCPEQSLGLVHAQEVVGQQQLELPPTNLEISFQTNAVEVQSEETPTLGEGNGETLPSPDQCLGFDHAEAEGVEPEPSRTSSSLMCHTRAKYGPALGKFETDPNEPWELPNKFDKNCPSSCPQKIVQSLRSNECEVSTDRVILTESFAKLQARQESNCYKGYYALNWDGTVLPDRNRVILYNDKAPHCRAPGQTERDEYFTNPNTAMKKLEQYGFFKTIKGWNCMTVDVESLDEWEKNNAVRERRADPFILFHCADPKGTILVVQCLFDGRSFNGRTIPKEILDLLGDDKIVKMGSGVSRDLAQLYKATAHRLSFTGYGPTLELSALMLFLNPVEDQGEHRKPRTGISAAYKMMGLDHLIDKNHAACINATWYSLSRKNKKRVYDYSQAPYSYTKRMILYNDGDVLLPFAILDRAVVKLCDQYQFKECPDADVSLIRLAVFSLLIYNAPISNYEDANYAAKLKYAPTTLFNGYNPFNKAKYNAPYDDPAQLMTKIRHFLSRRKVPFMPMMHNIKLTDACMDGFRESLRGYKDDAKIVIRGFRLKVASHRCIICEACSHTESDCSVPLPDYLCKYPLCDVRTHKTFHCPSMTQRCYECNELGHDESRHSEEKFDVLTAWRTCRHFARKHQYFNMVNAKDTAAKVYHKP